MTISISELEKRYKIHFKEPIKKADTSPYRIIGSNFPVPWTSSAQSMMPSPSRPANTG
jgi:hypothetical protein